MATTGTYDFALDTLDVIEEAFERCGRDPQTLNHRHLRSAVRSLNLLGIEIENEADIPFRIDRVQYSLSEGERGFFLPAGTINVLAVDLIATNNETQDVIPLRRATIEQMSQLSRTQNGRPVQFAVVQSLPGEVSLIDTGETAGAAGSWGSDITQGDGEPTDRPALMIWQASDRDDDILAYWRLRSAQDSTSLTDVPDYPRNWFEGICAGLAWKLALKWAPDRLAGLERLWIDARAKAFRGGRSRDDIMVYARGIGNKARRRRW